MLLFGHDGLGRGGAGVEGVKHGHAAHDETQHGSQRVGAGSLALRRAQRHQFGGGAAGIANQAHGQGLLLGRVRVQAGGFHLFDDHAQTELGAGRAVDGAFHQGAHNAGREGEGGVVV